MRLGCFSVSLAVKDIQKSKAFYEALGFEKFHGDEAQGWLIMKNHDINLGLFQGMFDKNILTFNPKWDGSANAQDDWPDIRDIQKALKERGLALEKELKEGTSGPASITLIDPDGNPILIDQHV